MGYLEPGEYVQYGLKEETLDATVNAASAMIDGFCRRPTLGVQSYTETLRFGMGTNRVRLSVLPLVAVTQMRVRLARGCGQENALQDAVDAFGLAGTWTELDLSQVESSADGDVSVFSHVLGAPFDEAEVTYTAGFAEVPAAVKWACAQVVRNAQATPALNVKSTTVDAMQMNYFSGSLLTEDVKRMLRPYMAERFGR